MYSCFIPSPLLSSFFFLCIHVCFYSIIFWRVLAVGGWDLNLVNGLLKIVFFMSCLYLINCECCGLFLGGNLRSWYMAFIFFFMMLIKVSFNVLVTWSPSKFFPSKMGQLWKRLSIPFIIRPHFLAKKTKEKRGACHDPKWPVGVLPCSFSLEERENRENW